MSSSLEESFKSRWNTDYWYQDSVVWDYYNNSVFQGKMRQALTSFYDGQVQLTLDELLNSDIPITWDNSP